MLTNASKFRVVQQKKSCEQRYGRNIHGPELMKKNLQMNQIVKIKTICLTNLAIRLKKNISSTTDRPEITNLRGSD